MSLTRVEFRIVLPITVEEYELGQLWSTTETSINETGQGEGVEVLVNEPRVREGLGHCQYTHKIHHLNSAVPRIIRALAPKGSLELHEQSFNAYPNIDTAITNPDYMKNGFIISIKSKHLPDFGDSENVHDLSPEEWKATEVIKIDIANEVSSREYRKEYDPKLFRSAKTGRGPLESNWIDQLRAEKEKSGTPAYMCIYKLVSYRFEWFGLQSKVEALINKIEMRLFTLFNRQVFCWIDKWMGLTKEQIREFEHSAKQQLGELRASSAARPLRVLINE